jgi:RimJ/RimL family protein N-acetyltransferase
MSNSSPAGEIGFRPLEYADLPLMQRWRGEPHVQRFYGPPATLEELGTKYGPRIEGKVPTRSFVMLLAGQPIGYIQSYRIEDHPDYAAAVDIGPGAVGVDLYIGEPELIHRGLGTRVLRAFLAEHVFSDPRIQCNVLGPDPENLAAIRCYEKAGFRFLKQVRVPGEEQPEWLMVLDAVNFRTGGEEMR